MRRRVWIIGVAVLGLLCTAQFWNPPLVRWFSSSTSVDVFGTDGLRRAQFRADHMIPPDCPTDFTTLEVGSICKRASDQRLIFRDGTGVFVLSSTTVAQ